MLYYPLEIDNRLYYKTFMFPINVSSQHVSQLARTNCYSGHGVIKAATLWALHKTNYLEMPKV